MTITPEKMNRLGQRLTITPERMQRLGQRLTITPERVNRLNQGWSEATQRIQRNMSPEHLSKAGADAACQSAPLEFFCVLSFFW